MTPDIGSGPGREAPSLTITVDDGRQACLAFSGGLDARMNLALEERLGDPALREVRAWLLDLHDLQSMDLACAYALRRAATELSPPAGIRVRGASPGVRRTLHDAGADAVMTFGG
ncbi:MULTISPECIES: STAS domain-containing protein [unclassified Streptomyces]|uniref:STAS domain-containing protein n=1 Tax=unclassified Streptomyces TaxID=2593676 RepID=UPI001D0443BE|nr:MULTISPECIES: STAS domain-containing protein [unclassified Streptomyces]